MSPLMNENSFSREGAKHILFVCFVVEKVILW